MDFPNLYCRSGWMKQWHGHLRPKLTTEVNILRL